PAGANRAGAYDRAARLFAGQPSGPDWRAPGRGLGHDQPVAEEALGIDRVVAEPVAQLLAQLADVALDHVLLDLVVEDAVDRVENLGLGDAAAGIGRQIFEDAALSARQRQRHAVNLGIATVHEDAHGADLDVVDRLLGAAADRRD